MSQIQAWHRGMEAERMSKGHNDDDNNKKLKRFSETFSSCSTGDWPHLETLNNGQGRR